MKLPLQVSNEKKHAYTISLLMIQLVPFRAL